jgi:formylmethanofuran:tetrahydromethanopterin formyltransferase
MSGSEGGQGGEIRIVFFGDGYRLGQEKLEAGESVELPYLKGDVTVERRPRDTEVKQ